MEDIPSGAQIHAHPVAYEAFIHNIILPDSYAIDWCGFFTEFSYIFK